MECSLKCLSLEVLNSLHSFISQLNSILAGAYPGRVKAPFLTAPKWLLWLVGPLAGMPRDVVTNGVGLPGPNFSSSKAELELGLKFLPFEETVKDQAAKMMELKLIK